MLLMGSSFFSMAIVLVFYALVLLLIVSTIYLVIRKAVMHGILDARAKIKELEEGQPQPPVFQ